MPALARQGTRTWLLMSPMPPGECGRKSVLFLLVPPMSRSMSKYCVMSSSSMTSLLLMSATCEAEVCKLLVSRSRVFVSQAGSTTWR